MTWMIAGLCPTSVSSPRAGASAAVRVTLSIRRPSARAERLPQRGDVVRLADEVVRACPDGFAGRGRVSEGRKHEDERARIALPRDTKEVEPARAGHAKIGEDGVEWSLRAECLDRLAGRQRGDDLVRLPLEHLGEQTTCGLVVVHQE